MHLVPTQDEVIELLRRTGGLRLGHFEYPNGWHTDEYLQVALSIRSYDTAKILSVGLSRMLRANSEIRAMIPELSIVAPATGGLPVAFGVCEALRARQVYWAERDEEAGHLRLRQFMEVKKGEKVFLVDDIMRTGAKLAELKTLMEQQGAEIVGVGVIVSQPVPSAPDFAPLPFYSLARLEGTVYKDVKHCDLCARGVPIEKTWG